MPFKSEKQRRYLWANEPEIARDWSDTYGHRAQGYDGGVMRVPFQDAGSVLTPEQIKMIKDMTARGVDTSTIESIAQVTSDQISAVINSPTGEAQKTGGLDNISRSSTDPRIEEFLKNDPFYWSGRVKLENVKPFSADPNIERAKKNIKKRSLGYNPYSDPNIYVRNINEPSAAVGSDVTHEGVHDVVAPTFADLSERGIVQDILTDYNSTLPPGERNKIEPKEMNEIVTNYISNAIHGDVESVDDETLENPALMQALQKNINPETGQGFIKNWASRAHQNIEAMSPERIDQMMGKFPSNQGLKFRDAQNYQQWREANPDAFSGIKENIQSGVVKVKDKAGRIVQGVKDALGNIVDGAGNIIQTAADYARTGSSWVKAGITAALPFPMNLLSTAMSYGPSFERKGATSRAGGYSIAQQNQMNALGGYYSEPARQQRRTLTRIEDMKARRARGDPYSKPNLTTLLQQTGQQDTWQPPVKKPIVTTSTVAGPQPYHQQDGGGGQRNGGGGGYGKGRDPGGGAAGSPFYRGGLASLWT